MSQPKNDVKLKIRGGQSKIYGIQDYWGEIDIYKTKIHIGSAGFTVSSYQIYLDTILVNDKWQSLGYGKMMMDIIKGYARLMKKPIVLYSLDDVGGFYEKQGFKSIRKMQKAGKKFIIMTKPEVEPKIENKQLIWLPESLRRKIDLRIEL